MVAYLEFENKYTEQVKELIVNIMKEELDIRPSMVSNITQDLDNIEHNYINDGGNFWIAVDKNDAKVIGTVAVKNLDNLQSEFKRFYVHKNYRRKGVGSTLYEIANDFIENAGYKEAYLVSGEKSHTAQHIYMKDGWSIVDKDNENVNVFVRDGVELFKKCFN